MKRYIPIAVIIIFIVALLGLSNYVLEQRRQAAVQAAYEAQRHLVVYSDLPGDVNKGLADAFYRQTGWRVQIQTISDGQMRQRIAQSGSAERPDIIIASEILLQEQKKAGNLQAYVSPQIETVPEELRDPDGYWTGLWFNPMVFIISSSYYEKNGLAVQRWDDLRYREGLSVAFPDLAAMDLAGDFLCSFVEVKGQDAAGQYLRELQGRVMMYSKSMSANARSVAGGDADVGVIDGVTARQYDKDGAPIYIIYPRDGTSYWLTGAAISQWCTDGEMAYGFVNWLFSEDVGAILRKNHIYLSYASSSAPKTLDAKGEELVLFPVRKEYTAQGRRDLQDWWIKSVRFGKEK